MDLKVSKSKKGLQGSITIPPDKSISHRAVMLSSIAKGKTIIRNFLNAEDCLSTLNIFKSLGIDISFQSADTVVINSNGKLSIPVSELNCGNSGTTMRLMSGILAGQNFNSVLYGDVSLSKRPMKRIIEPLSLMGADIVSSDNHAPLKITGQKLYGINYISPLSSAQVKSSVLLAGLFADGETTVTESSKSRNHTELMLDYLGADINTNGNSVTVKKSELTAKDIDVAGDISSAAFFIAAALLVPNSDIILKNVGLNPTRTGIIDIIQKMNGNIEILDKRDVSGEIVGDIRVKYSDLISIEINGDDIPRLIDEIPVIALLCTQANGISIITDAEDLRNKETDRIKAIVTEFQKLGLNIEELPDGFVIFGKQNIKGGGELDVYHDHRIAMTLYIAGLCAEKDIMIKEFDWVNISMPQFLELFSMIS